MRQAREGPGAIARAEAQGIVSSKLNGIPCSTTPLWLARQAEALHARGPRPLGEILLELIEAFGPELRDFLRARLISYNRIPASTYRTLGGDRFAQPFAAIDGGRR